MLRALGAFAIALVLVGCTPTSSPNPPTPSPEAATLTVTGSGGLCGPWWFGCGAVLVIEPAGWVFREDWSRGPNDTLFDVDLRVATEEGALITGVAHLGQDRIEPGDYTVAGILTSQSDVGTEPPSAKLGCSSALPIRLGTVMVAINIVFTATGCHITVIQRLVAS